MGLPSLDTFYERDHTVCSFWLWLPLLSMKFSRPIHVMAHTTLKQTHMHIHTLSFIHSFCMSVCLHTHKGNQTDLIYNYDNGRIKFFFSSLRQCSPGWFGTCYVDQAHLELTEASQTLALKAALPYSRQDWFLPAFLPRAYFLSFDKVLWVESLCPQP